MSTPLVLDQLNNMSETPALDLEKSLDAEHVINQSDTTLPDSPKSRCMEIAKEKQKSFDEDYIPLVDTSTDAKHDSDNEAIDETQICDTVSAERKQERHRRIEAETHLLRQANIKREMTRARKAASAMHDYSTFSLFGGSNDALVEELKLPLYAINLVYPSEQDIIDQGVTCFAGQVIIRPHLEAMEYALDEYKGRRKIPGRVAFWVDGSCSSRGLSGTAVVFRANPRVVGSKWTTRAYTVLEFDRLGTVHTEALAIMHAMRIALARAIHCDGTDAKASDVVIFSDSMSALHKIKSFTHEGQCWMRSLLGRIVTLTNELSVIGVKVQLHWVPAHKGIPGNYLADALAKRATRRQVQGRRYLSTGHDQSNISSA